MKSRGLLSVGLCLTVVVSVVSGEPLSPEIRVIDGQPPASESLRLSSLSGPLEPMEAESGVVLLAQVSTAERQMKYTEMRAKGARRRQAIEAFFGKMKQNMDDPAPRENGSGLMDSSLPLIDIPEMGPNPPAPVSSASSATKRSGGTYYKVQKGDNLGQISRKFYGTMRNYRNIAEANFMSPKDILKIGQELLIPDVPTGTRPRTAARKASSTSRPAPVKKPADRKPARAAPGTSSRASGTKLDYSSYEFKLYEVQSGDTLASVANKFYQGKGDPSLIRLYNNKKAELTPGEKILIPLPKRDMIDQRYEKAVNGQF